MMYEIFVRYVDRDADLFYTEKYEIKEGSIVFDKEAGTGIIPFTYVKYIFIKEKVK